MELATNDRSEVARAAEIDPRCCCAAHTGLSTGPHVGTCQLSSDTLCTYLGLQLVRMCWVTTVESATKQVGKVTRSLEVDAINSDE